MTNVSIHNSSWCSFVLAYVFFSFSFFFTVSNLSALLKIITNTNQQTRYKQASGFFLFTLLKCIAVLTSFLIFLWVLVLRLSFWLLYPSKFAFCFSLLELLMFIGLMSSYFFICRYSFVISAPARTFSFISSEQILKFHICYIVFSVVVSID